MEGVKFALAWSPDAKYIATGEQDSTVHFWRVKSGADAQMWGFPTKVLQLSWSNGRALVSYRGRILFAFGIVVVKGQKEDNQNNMRHTPIRLQIWLFNRWAFFGIYRFG